MILIKNNFIRELSLFNLRLFNKPKSDFYHVTTTTRRRLYERGTQYTKLTIRALASQNVFAIENKPEKCKGQKMILAFCKDY